MHLDAHEKPPSYLRAIFKRNRSTRDEDPQVDADVYDSHQLAGRRDLKQVDWRSVQDLEATFGEFLGTLNHAAVDERIDSIKQGYICTELPYLLIVPNVIPIAVQKELLTRIFHRELSNPKHQTNVSLHHNVVYPDADTSFFQYAPTGQPVALPNDPQAHKSMNAGQLLDRKLRWITLGGQYDWTRKVYPSQAPPAFPHDISRLLQGLFPDTTPEAAIVNLYSPGDTLSMHRDVSEDCDHGLISISIGCDALFVIGLNPSTPNDAGRHAVIRLKSGDAVYMAGESRFAWHGVPRIFPNTCPKELRDWPFDEAPDSVTPESYKDWRGWMSGKRINLNVRQMKG